MSFSSSRENRIKLVGLGVIAAFSILLIYQWKFRSGSRSEADGRPLTEQERKEIEVALARGGENAQAADAGWRIAMAEADAKNVVGDRDAGDCPTHVPLHPATDKNPPLWLNRLKAENVKRENSAWGKFYAAESKRIKKAIDLPNTAEEIGKLSGDAIRTRLLNMEWEVTFVADVENEPKYRYSEGPMGKEYVPGTISGNVYVYDYRSKKIECAAHITAENAPVIKYEYQRFTDPKVPDFDQGRLELEQRLRQDLLEVLYLKLSTEIRYRARVQ